MKKTLLVISFLFLIGTFSLVEGGNTGSTEARREPEKSKQYIIQKNTYQVVGYWLLNPSHALSFLTNPEYSQEQQVGYMQVYTRVLRDTMDFSLVDDVDMHMTVLFILKNLFVFLDSNSHTGVVSDGELCNTVLNFLESLLSLIGHHIDIYVPVDERHNPRNLVEFIRERQVNVQRNHIILSILTPGYYFIDNIYINISTSTDRNVISTHLETLLTMLRTIEPEDIMRSNSNNNEPLLNFFVSILNSIDIMLGSGSEASNDIEVAELVEGILQNINRLTRNVYYTGDLSLTTQERVYILMNSIQQNNYRTAIYLVLLPYFWQIFSGNDALKIKHY